MRVSLFFLFFVSVILKQLSAPHEMVVVNLKMEPLALFEVFFGGKKNAFDIKMFNPISLTGEIWSESKNIPVV